MISGRALVIYVPMHIRTDWMLVLDPHSARCAVSQLRRFSVVNIFAPLE